MACAGVVDSLCDRSTNIVEQDNFNILCNLVRCVCKISVGRNQYFRLTCFGVQVECGVERRRQEQADGCLSPSSAQILPASIKSSRNPNLRCGDSFYP